MDRQQSRRRGQPLIPSFSPVCRKISGSGGSITMADRISKLPDELLCHILSFIPTQDVVATSLLSKRWTRLWRLVPGLYFDDKSYLINNKPYDSLNKFIYASILARDAHQPIKRFRLQCGAPNFNLSESHLAIWVNNAMQRGLESLHIQLPSKVSVLTLRSCVFSFKTLVVLKLEGLDVDVISSVDLPSLKTMDLNDVFFPEQKHFMELFSGCPNLEKMQLKNIGCEDSSTPTPSNKEVKILSKLVRADINDIALDIPLKAVCNVEFLRVAQVQPPHGGILVFPNLTHVELLFGSNMDWHLVLAIIKKSPKLQIFALHMETSAADAVWTSPSAVPKCLSSQLRVCSITNFDGTRSKLHFVKYIMKNSEVLRTMTICTKPSLSLELKFEILQELSLCPRSSTICELSFK